MEENANTLLGDLLMREIMMKDIEVTKRSNAEVPLTEWHKYITIH